MGNTASAWPEREACAMAPAMPSTPHQPTTLSERVAWDIATAWHASLHTVVRVRPERSRRNWPYQLEPYGVADDLEWIEFNGIVSDVSRASDTARAARAAVMAWCALSCCRGFGGHENPVFWKRVFSTFARATPDDTAVAGEPLTDYQRFFPDADTPFPRVRIWWHNAQPLEVWWERPSQRRRHRHEYKLRRMLQSLAPYMSMSQYAAREIDLCVYVVTHVPLFVATLERLHLARRDTKVDPTEPVLRLTCVTTRDHQHEVSKAVACYTNAVHVIETDQPAYFFLNAIDRTVASLVAQQTKQRDPHAHVRIDVLSMFWGDPSLANRVAAATYSTLPHLTTVRCVTDSRGGDDWNAAWLGYALFHPDTAVHSSSAKNLTLAVTVSGSAMLRCMAEGNNLLLAMGVSTTPVTGYAQARVRAGTAVRSVPLDATTSDPGDPLIWLPSACWLALCELLDDTAAVRVVLPGHGIAWIATTDIVEVLHRAPAPSPVTRLRLQVPNDRPGDYTDALSDATKTALLDHIAVFGSRLTYLNVITARSLAADTVQSLLLLCPQLTSLVIDHDGSCWSNPDPMLSLPPRPRLRELVLHSRAPHVPLLEAPQLDDLAVLRLMCRNVRDFSSESIRALLVRFPSLTSLAFEHRDWSGDKARTFQARRQRSWWALRPVTAGVHDVAHVALLPATRIALLSVVAHSVPTRTVARLPPDVLRLILRFSASAVPRHLHIVT